MAGFDFFSKFNENARELHDHPVFQILAEEGRETFTYQQVHEETTRLSVFFRESGLQPGDRIGILMENHPRWGMAFLAAQSAGAVVVPFDVLHPVETLVRLVQHSECSWLISSRRIADKLGELQRLLPRPLTALVHEWDESMAQEGWIGWESALERSSGELPRLPLVERSPQDTLVIIYTSGTTGDPKGVMLPQRAIDANVAAVLRRLRFDPSDHILGVLPLYHALALMANFIIPLYVGLRTTYLPVLDAQKVLQAFREEGITVFAVVPQFFYMVHRRIFQKVSEQGLLKRRLFHLLLAISRMLKGGPGKLFFGAVHQQFGKRFRIFAVGGASFDARIAETFRDLGFNMVQAYGMTETAAVATLLPYKSPKVSSVGKPLSSSRIRIDRPDQDGIGEVLIAGDSLMTGYWKNPAATAEALDQDGWLHSGDLGRLDSDGLLYLTGRAKDVIVLSSGKNIFPEELEHFFLDRVPIIQEICILGVPDQSGEAQEEKLHAVVVPDFEELKRRGIANAGEMIRFMILDEASQALPAYKRVRSFSVRRDPLPRTTTRKIKRFQVMQEWQSESQGDSAPAQPLDEQQEWRPIERRLLELIEQFRQVDSPRPEMHLELDAGFDSLQRVEFFSSVHEVFSVEIPDEEAAEIFTIRDLAAAIEARQSEEAAGHDGEGESGRQSWSRILREPLAPEDAAKVGPYLSPKPVLEVLFFLLSLVMNLAARVLFRFKIEGRGNLPQGRPFLICPNHLSYLDAPLVIAALPYSVLKRLFFLGYADLFSGRLKGWLGRLIKVVPVDSDRHLRQALRLGAEGLRQGLSLCIFPEGQRSYTGELQEFRKGPALLAEALQVEVVPVHISGSYEAWPPGAKRWRLRPITLRFGKPVAPPSGSQSIDEYTLQLRAAVAEIGSMQESRVA